MPAAAEHHHDHHHGHACDHRHAATRRSLFLSFLMVAGFMVVEAAGGWYTNSLALWSDAGHMLTDAGALAFSLLALKIGELPPSPTKTFGYRRFEILAALGNGLALWTIVGVILHEAYSRLHTPPEVKAPVMIAVAAIGLLVNLISIKLLHAHKDDSLNVRGAFLHVLADLLGSVGALTAGLVMLTTGWRLIDPLISLGICLLILWSSWGIVRDAVHILLLGVPTHLDYREVEQEILGHPGVCCLYDLHIWAIASGQEAVTAHVVIPNGYGRQQELLAEIVAGLQHRFGIAHATIQIEESHDLKENRGDSACRVGNNGSACAFGKAEG
ncbi:MAG: cation transporter [Desulfobulbaceae bacterium]|nr:cation transporter [Desulfobulbaceae bacterium]